GAFFLSGRRRHTSFSRDWSSDVCSSDLDGEEQRVRLLNVDAPEVDQCVHDEATAFLAERVPPGTEVVLELDEEHHDQYGRLLAEIGRASCRERAENSAGALRRVLSNVNQ